MWIKVCFFISDFWWNLFPQYWHGYGLVSLWINICVLRVDDLLNALPHSGHRNARWKSDTSCNVESSNICRSDQVGEDWDESSSVSKAGREMEFWERKSKNGVNMWHRKQLQQSDVRPSVSKRNKCLGMECRNSEHARKSSWCCLLSRVVK